jgi:hypothetical protein
MPKYRPPPRTESGGPKPRSAATKKTLKTCKNLQKPAKTCKNKLNPKDRLGSG